MHRRLSVSVDTHTHRALKVRAAELDCSMNDIVVDAVKAYLRNCCKSGDDKNVWR